MQKPLKFTPLAKDEFIVVLRKRVKQYFTDTNQSTHANTAMVLRTLLFASFWLGSYSLLLFAGFSTPINYAISALYGVSIALVCVNVGHDAIHGAYSKSKFVNGLLSMTFNLNGASAYMWAKMHNVAHHSYTNIHGYDEDISPIPIIRLSPESELKPIHKHQHWYAPLFYCLATLSWVFLKDYIKFFQNTVGNYGDQKHPTKEYFYLFLYKAIYYAIFIVTPFLVIDQPWYHTVGCILTFHAFAGFYLAIVFMLAHAVESIQFPLPTENGSIENSWAIHQLETTSNFVSRSLLGSALSGGLNTQVEHHLFPNICHIHYRHLAKIIQETAEEYGVAYLDYPSFSSAVRSHLRFMHKMGHEKTYTPINPAELKKAA